MLVPADASSTLPKPGTLFCGKYEISHALGGGGMGVVLAARHIRLDQPVALKFLRDEQLTDLQARLRFEREARAAARLASPHAVRILDVDSTPEGVPFIVMEILHGHDLSSELKKLQRLPYADVVDWVMEACHAVAEAHNVGIVHRDLKPSNLFKAEGPHGESVVKVLDFGISKILDAVEPELTNTDMTLGTPHYMSPEQVGVGKVVDGRTDTWALSVILYRAITGAYPFHAQSATQIAVAIATEPAVPIDAHLSVDPIPPGLSQAIMKGLDKDPNRRWQDAISLAEAISPFGSGKTAPPIRQSRPRTDPLRNRPATQPPPPVSVGSGALTVDEQSAPTQAVPSASMTKTSNLASVEIPVNVEPKSSPKKIWFAIAAALGVIGVVLVVLSLKHTKTAAADPKPAPPPVAVEPPKVEPTPTPIETVAAPVAPSASVVAPVAKPHTAPTKKPVAKPTTAPVDDPVHL